MRTKFLLICILLPVLSMAGSIEDLISACKKNDLAGAQKAIDAGADVNGKDADGWYPLGASILSPDITRLLIEKKADPNLGNSPALVNAAGVGSYEVLQILLNAGAEPNKPIVIDPSATFQKLLDAEKAKGKTANKYIIKAYEDGIANAKKGNSTIIYAIQNVVTRSLCKECLELLIEKGAKTDFISPISGGNLLDELAFSALPPSEWIVNNKPQVEGWEKLGFTTPDWYKNPDPTKLSSTDGMVKILVKAGVNINAVNNLKNTPLLTSMGRFTQTRSEVILGFINNGSDINAESLTQGHPLLQAAGYGFVDVLDALFAKGADMKREFKVDDYEKGGQRLKGITPLMWAARNGKLDAVKYLVNKGVNLDEKAYGFSTNLKTQCLTKVRDKSAIFYAIEGENPEVIKFLVENTQQNWKKEMTVDQWKTETKYTSGIWEITRTTCFHDKDYSPAEYAKDSGLTEIADYLKSKNL